MDRVDVAPNMAVFCDFENVAIGVRDARFAAFDIDLVLERLLHKGKVVVKKAYADWDRYKSAKRGMHEAGFEMIEIPHVSYSGKNSADIRLVVDALDLCYVKQHVDVFVIISGDSDFSPLVSKLRENNKQVIGLGVKSSTSDLLIENCDEFIYYDDLVREKPNRRTENGAVRAPAIRMAKPERSDAQRNEPRSEAQRNEPRSEAQRSEPRSDSKSMADAESGSFRLPDADAKDARVAKTPEQRKLEALEMVLDTVEALFRDHDGALHGSLIKQTLKRGRPNFSERFHGYRTFSELLADAGKRGVLEVQSDDKSGGFLVTAFGANA